MLRLPLHHIFTPIGGGQAEASTAPACEMIHFHLREKMCSSGGPPLPTTVSAGFTSFWSLRPRSSSPILLLASHQRGRSISTV